MPVALGHSAYAGKIAGDGLPLPLALEVSGADPALLALVAFMGPGATPTAVTWQADGYDVQTLIELETARCGSGPWGRIYALTAPSSGSGWLEVATSGAGFGDLLVCGLAFSGVDPAAPWSGIQTVSNDFESPVQLAVASAPGDMVVDLVVAMNLTTVTAAPAQQVVMNTTMAGTRGGASWQPGAAEVVMQWTTTTQMGYPIAHLAALNVHAATDGGNGGNGGGGSGAGAPRSALGIGIGDGL